MCKYKKNASIHVMNYFISGLRNLCKPADRLRNKQRYKTIKSCIAGINESAHAINGLGLKVDPMTGSQSTPPPPNKTTTKNVQS